MSIFPTGCRESDETGGVSTIYDRGWMFLSGRACWARSATAGREREAGAEIWAEQGAGWISGGSWDGGGWDGRGAVGSEVAAGAEGGRWGEGRGRRERAKGEGERRGRKERAKGEGGACHGARTKVSGQKARWRLAGGRWAHEGAGCKCGPDNADKTQSIYRAIKKPPLLGTGAWGITCPEAGERFIRSDDDQKK